MLKSHRNIEKKIPFCLPRIPKLKDIKWYYKEPQFSHGWITKMTKIIIILMN